MLEHLARWKPARLGIGLLGVLLAVAAIWLLTQPVGFEAVWPWDTYYSGGFSPLSYYFLSSIALAIAAPLLWIAATDSVQTSAGGALDLTLMFGGLCVFLVTEAQQKPDNPRLMTAAVVVGLSALVNFAVFLLTRKLPAKSTLGLPLPVKVSFGVFAVTLILVGGSLILKRPNILPWDLSVEAGVVYGWIYVGAAVYFVYALFRPLWEYAAGPLIGFLAYDLILILPFIARFSEVPPAQRLSLIVYTAVVTYSGILATYYLFINRNTRIQGNSRSA